MEDFEKLQECQDYIERGYKVSQEIIQTCKDAGIAHKPPVRSCCALLSLLNITLMERLDAKGSYWNSTDDYRDTYKKVLQIICDESLVPMPKEISHESLREANVDILSTLDRLHQIGEEEKEGAAAIVGYYAACFIAMQICYDVAELDHFNESMMKGFIGNLRNFNELGLTILSSATKGDEDNW